MPPTCYFLDCPGGHAPEIYPRPDKQTYACTGAPDTPLPESPDQVKPDEDSLKRLRLTCSTLFPDLTGNINY